MTRRHQIAFPARRAVLETVLGAALCLGVVAAQAATYPITAEQKTTAQKVAQAGVPLAELAPNAPDSYTVKAGDTLWDISALFLKSPWRWPELWGMNLEQIRNPHLIYPGQVLFLEKADGRARLRVGQPVESGPDGTTRLSPRVRASALGNALSSIALSAIEPFMNEAVIFETDELQMAPRIVATQEGSVLLSRGDLAYARGDLAQQREYRIFREPRPMLDPTTGELLGFEASFVGTADYTRPGETRSLADGTAQIVPATLQVTSVRKEAGVGDRLSPVPPREFTNYAPHAPARPLSGQIVSIYGEGLSAGQSHIVSLNRGAVDGVEPGYVLALWRAGSAAVDTTDPQRPLMQLPDERGGILFVFRVFKRMSYALIVKATDPVGRGDRFSEP